MAPKMTESYSNDHDGYHHHQQQDDDDCRSQGSQETEYTFETMQTDDYTYVTYETMPATAPSVPTIMEEQYREPVVHFCPHVAAEFIETWQEYSHKEHKNCWYTPEDKLKMEAKHIKVVTRFASGKSAKRGQTYRGLETSTLEGAKRLQSTVARCVDAVMDEQDRQWKAFCDDYDQLAAVSLEASEQSKCLAYEIALRDAREAKAVQRELSCTSLTSQTSQGSKDELDKSRHDSPLNESLPQEHDESLESSESPDTVILPPHSPSTKKLKGHKNSKKKTKKGGRRSRPQPTKDGAAPVPAPVGPTKSSEALAQMAHAVQRMKSSLPNKRGAPQPPTFRGQCLATIPESLPEQQRIPTLPAM